MWEPKLCKCFAPRHPGIRIGFWRVFFYFNCFISAAESALPAHPTQGERNLRFQG
jgi:hypothetical protein